MCRLSCASLLFFHSRCIGSMRLGQEGLLSFCDLQSSLADMGIMRNLDICQSMTQGWLVRAWGWEQPSPLSLCPANALPPSAPPHELCCPCYLRPGMCCH